MSHEFLHTVVKRDREFQLSKLDERSAEYVHKLQTVTPETNLLRHRLKRLKVHIEQSTWHYHNWHWPKNSLPSSINNTLSLR